MLLQVQCVATIADGIDCISWSLDQDLAIVANSELVNIILLN